MKGIGSRLGAMIGALGIVACASPLAAQTWRHHGRLLRYEAVWVERSQAAMRGPAPWLTVPGPAVRARLAETRWIRRPWRAAAWRQAAWRRAAWRRAAWRPLQWRRPGWRRI